MLSVLLKLLSLLTGKRILEPEQAQTLQQKLLHLEQKAQALDHLAAQLKQQERMLNQQHHTELQTLQDNWKRQLAQRDSQISTLKSQLDLLHTGMDGLLNTHYQENKALLNQLNWLSGTIAHDFRAPLRAIDANSFFLEDDLGDQGPPDALKSLSEIRRNGKRMGLLIDGLLDYLRMGITPMSQQEVDLGEIIRQVVAQDYTSSPIDVPVDLHLHVRGDKALLQRLFKELIDNAVKFSAGVNAPQVRIRQAGERAIEIIDNGVGFSQAHRDQLFKLFHRLHGNDEFAGEGIGLCIAERIAQRHGGRISLDRTASHTIAFVELTEPLTQATLESNSRSAGSLP